MDVRFTDDGWFDATAVATKYGKRTAEWLRLPATVAYIDALNRKYGNFPHLKTRRGVGGGTWMHPKLAVRFAQWLDVDFAVWCDEQIEQLIRDGYARISDAERTHWRQMLELEKRDESSKVRASFGSHLMLQRKREKPSIEKERERLATALQPSFKFH
ncbi:KilA-N domain-containing protein [Burkholderia gladioli]|uniref:KilA-N domain-containing protein n=1 Tax=Burkholderia gladioli TaxID=28095 RepID=UPI001641BB59|nr:KilA-N domain-containing protein [Burkholderia gladioli]